MLLQTFKPNDIVTMKLVTGEEIITKFVSADDSAYKIGKPLVLSATSQGVAMTPFLFTADLTSEINIPKNCVIAMAITEKYPEDEWEERVEEVISKAGTKFTKSKFGNYTFAISGSLVNGTFTINQ